MGVFFCADFFFFLTHELFRSDAALFLCKEQVQEEVYKGNIHIIESRKSNDDDMRNKKQTN